MEASASKGWLQSHRVGLGLELGISTIGKNPQKYKAWFRGHRKGEFL